MLLFVQLSATTEFSQLFKLPVLWQHYQEHKEENKDVSFISYLTMHYLNGDAKDADYERDMQLPFKTGSNYQVSSVASILPAPITATEPPVYYHLSEIVTSDDTFISSQFLSAIWQPPKA
ncbi:hypothetical protein SAMN05444008_101167 [Cnuella takakiae]|uniref:Uncharacterized protein n=1 Tax=Cnuella takakiae TaxID=1302690 RepID=A0A1M4SLI0_9BACT|nr:hypothetical protein SAMN05444008_101167 [Cnuella takakiae]